MPRRNPKRKLRYESSDDDLIINIDWEEEKEKKELDFPDFSVSVKNIKTIKDLIQIGEEWNKYYNDNKFYLKRLCKKQKVKDAIYNNREYQKIYFILNELQDIDQLVGLNELKKSIVNQILFFVQNLDGDEMMHTVLMGEPGVGKTECARILGRMYASLGMLSNGKFIIANRSDFVGKYLGHTAAKTQKLLESCKGGVLFIDEAYSLGPQSGDNDSFSKEAIDTLNQFLSENNKDFICIIAGYEDSLNKCFFRRNQGLERRFPWKFKLTKYSPEELVSIFFYCIEKERWKQNFPKSEILPLFQKNKQLFTHNGGDCKILLDKCKIVHARRLFLATREEKDNQKFIINKKDVEDGFKIFIEAKDKQKEEKPPMGLYC